MTKMTEEKGPHSLITTSGWCYQIVVQGAQCSFAYEVTVYKEGKSVAHDWCMTKVGARYKARSIRRRHYRRQRLTGETRSL